MLLFCVLRNGCSESGVYIAAHWLIDMAQLYQEVDVYDTVFNMRSTRPQFIENIVSNYIKNYYENIVSHYYDIFVRNYYENIVSNYY